MIVKCDSDGINIVKKSLQKDGVIIFPTDTVYGIGCNPYNTKAIKMHDSQFHKLCGMAKYEYQKSLPQLQLNMITATDIL